MKGIDYVINTIKNYISFLHVIALFSMSENSITEAILEGIVNYI